MPSTDNTNSSAIYGKLMARPTIPAGEKSVTSGLLSFRLEDASSVLLYVPSNYRTDSPPPLVLMLHGAGGNARGGLTSFLPVYVFV